MFSWSSFKKSSLTEKISTLFRDGTFVTDIRYYKYKVNLYLLRDDYVEVFINHKEGAIERIELLNHKHTRMKFYCDKITLKI